MNKKKSMTIISLINQIASDIADAVTASSVSINVGGAKKEERQSFNPDKELDALLKGLAKLTGSSIDDSDFKDFINNVCDCDKCEKDCPMRKSSSKADEREKEAFDRKNDNEISKNIENFVGRANIANPIDKRASYKSYLEINLTIPVALVQMTKEDAAYKEAVAVSRYNDSSEFVIIEKVGKIRSIIIPVRTDLARALKERHGVQFEANADITDGVGYCASITVSPNLIANRIKREVVIDGAKDEVGRVVVTREVTIDLSKIVEDWLYDETGISLTELARIKHEPKVPPMSTVHPKPSTPEDTKSSFNISGNLAVTYPDAVLAKTTVNIMPTVDHPDSMISRSAVSTTPTAYEPHTPSSTISMDVNADWAKTDKATSFETNIQLRLKTFVKDSDRIRLESTIEPSEFSIFIPREIDTVTASDPKELMGAGVYNVIADAGYSHDRGYTVVNKTAEIGDIYVPVPRVMAMEMNKLISAFSTSNILKSSHTLVTPIESFITTEFEVKCDEEVDLNIVTVVRYLNLSSYMHALFTELDLLDY